MIKDGAILVKPVMESVSIAVMWVMDVLMNPITGKESAKRFVKVNIKSYTIVIQNIWYEITEIKDYLTKQLSIWNVVDCKWGDWDDWTTCTQTCETQSQKGSKSRERSKVREAKQGGAACAGEATETQDCPGIPCPSNISCFRLEDVIISWLNWRQIANT